MVCPYSLDVPGGVQSHVLGLAAALRTRGHTVRVLAPAEGPVPEFVTPVGRSVGVPYNGSVARVAFGPVAYARVRRWLGGHRFDVLHLHEPTTASVSAIALLLADGAGGGDVPHRDRAVAHARRVGRVRPAADGEGDGADRRLAVGAPGAGATTSAGMPSRSRTGSTWPRWPRPRCRSPANDTVAFLGRFDEPRKGMPVLLDALARPGPTGPAAGRRRTG